MSKERDDYIKKSMVVIDALVDIVREIRKELSWVGIDLRPEFKALDEALDQLKAPVDPGSPAGAKEDTDGTAH
jgi:hypothetical protein